jgi:CBS domain-containing protein
VSSDLVRDTPVLRADDSVETAVRHLLDTDLPALPVTDATGRYRGIFGEREFFAALFPGYLFELTYVGFVPRALEDALDERATCRRSPVGDYVNTEHVDVASDFSDAQVAETFLHQLSAHPARRGRRPRDGRHRSRRLLPSPCPAPPGERRGARFLAARPGAGRSADVKVGPWLTTARLRKPRDPPNGSWTPHRVPA